MAGSVSATTAIALASAAIGAGSLGYGIYSGQKASGAQQAALEKQTTAQQQATASALSTQRQSEVAQGAANQQAPDLTGILRRAAVAGAGPSATMLSGPTGVNPAGLTLGKSTLLGA